MTDNVVNTTKLEQFEKIAQELADCTFFAGVTTADIPVLLNCLAARHRRYRKGDFIMLAGNRAEHIGILLQGAAQIIQEDYWGNRNLIGHVAAGEVFAEAFACARMEALTVSVLALCDTEVLLIDAKRVLDTCGNRCNFHNQLIHNMVRTLAEHSMSLRNKLEDVSQHGTREKVLSYLSRQAQATGSRTVSIPFNRQQLANYLMVDRSALSSVLSRLQREGVLAVRKNHFELL